MVSESDPMASIQRMMSDPAVVLGAVQSDEQRQLQPTLDAALGALVGVVDYVSDAVAVRLIGGGPLVWMPVAGRPWSGSHPEPNSRRGAAAARSSPSASPLKRETGWSAQPRTSARPPTTCP